MCLQRHTDVCVTVSTKLNKVIYLCVHKPSPAMATCLAYRHYYKIHLFFWCGLPTEQHSVPYVFKRMCRSLYLHSCKRTWASQVKALVSCWPSGILCEQTLTIRAVIQRHCLPLQLLLSCQTSPFLSGEERQGIIFAHWHRYTHLDLYSYKNQGENIFKWPTEGCWLNSEAGSCRLLPVVWFDKKWTAS